MTTYATPGHTDSAQALTAGMFVPWDASKFSIDRDASRELAMKAAKSNGKNVLQRFSVYKANEGFVAPNETTITFTVTKFLNNDGTPNGRVKFGVSIDTYIERTDDDGTIDYEHVRVEMPITIWNSDVAAYGTELTNILGTVFLLMTYRDSGAAWVHTGSAYRKINYDRMDLLEDPDLTTWSDS